MRSVIIGTDDLVKKLFADKNVLNTVKSSKNSPKPGTSVDK